MGIFTLMYCDADHGELSVEDGSVHVAEGFADPERTAESWVEVRTPRDLYGITVQEVTHYCPDCAREAES